MEAIPDTRPRRSRASHEPARDFVSRHQVDLWRYLRFLGCPSDQVEDLLQDTFLAALQRDVHHQPDAVAAQWLRTTARNMFWMELRRTARRPNLVAIDLERLDAEWRAQSALGGAEQETTHAALSALDEVLPQLDEREQAVLTLRYERGCSREEMASRLGMTTHGVKSLLRRVRQKLRREIEALLHRNSEVDES